MTQLTVELWTPVSKLLPLTELRTVDLVLHTEYTSLLILAPVFQMGENIYTGFEDGCENWRCVLFKIKNFACICKTNVLK